MSANEKCPRCGSDLDNAPVIEEWSKRPFQYQCETVKENFGDLVAGTQSELCKERELRQKAEAEVAELKQLIVDSNLVEKTFFPMSAGITTPEEITRLFPADGLQTQEKITKLTTALAARARDISKLRDSLESLVKMDDLMNDPEYGDTGTYAGAYYAYYKGNCDQWNNARTLLKNTHN